MPTIIPFIFASGLGTRLRPHTNDVPKPLLPIKNEQTILDFSLDELAKHGFTEAFINYSYRLDLYQELAQRHPNLKITLIDDKEIAGQGGILLKERPKLAKYDYVLAINGDSVFGGVLPQFLEQANNNTVALLSNNKYPVTRNLICSENGDLYGISPRPNFDDHLYWYRTLSGKQEFNNYLGHLIMPTNLLAKIKYKTGFMSLFKEGELMDQLIKQGVTVKAVRQEVHLFLSANTEHELNEMRKALQ